MIVQASGTLASATINTEFVLADLTPALTYVGTVDLSGMLAGDTVALNIYVKVLTGGTLKSVYNQVFAGVQPAGSIVAVSLPVPSPFEWKFTLTQTAGTARSYDYNALSL